MKKENLMSRLEPFILPAALILCGVTLLLSPDTGSVLVSKILRIILSIWGFLCALGVLFSKNKIEDAITAAAVLSLSRWLGRNPLSLAEGFGRILGIGMLLSAIGGFLKSRQTVSRVVYAVLGVLGLVLLVLPMTASRLMFIVFGLGLAAAGVSMILSRLREQKYLDDGDDPNIIDAL